MIHAILFLALVAAANVTTSSLGPAYSPLVALVAIGATLTLRDRLHEMWQGRALTIRMAGLIAAGAALSLPFGTGRIALASFIAFAAGEAGDALAYHRLRHMAWLRRSNGSNLVGAAVDSVIFPVVAFGGFPWVIILLQFAAKVLGGGAWSVLLRPRPKRAAALAAGILIALTPSVLAGQTISASGAVLVTEHGRKPVAELFVAAPAVAGVTPSLIVSQPTEGGEPTYIVQASLDGPRRGRVFTSVSAGAAFYPFAGYRARPVVGAYVGVVTPLPRTHIFALTTVQPKHEWGWSVVTGASFTAIRR
jgi:queuosine precursor transporter